MHTFAFILLLVERGDRVHEGLNKALLVARHFRAKLDLFLCDTERYATTGSTASGGGRPGDARWVAEGTDYLQALRKSIVAPDVDISTEAICHRSLREAISERLERGRIDLIVKTTEASRRDAPRRGAGDWAALATCPVPLLLTRGRSWRPTPLFAAAVDTHDAAAFDQSRAVASLGNSLAGVCGAELDLLCARSERPSAVDDDALERLGQLAAAAHPRVVQHSRLLAGIATDVVPAYIVERDYDLVVLDKPRATGLAVLDSLAGKTLAVAGGDVVLASAPGQHSVGAAIAAAPRARQSPAN